ncbi:ubiquinol-cytochrome c reductase iron-sulfur subunit [Wohlfahrtiimonas populi]|uniref:ubiquinol-cytochrome c reductase iron-sulfur subunit n=1 Tax=Wohlfahrtiimonas populi TaxID=1940240 RepID=UPI00098CF180|nr:ubiquinol-cytochrome c reductase iron-sulfur subunit [Wohlfahrtiimonas populi]
MSDNNNVDLKRRRVLTLATSAVGGAGAMFLAYPFIASWMPSEKAKNAGAPVEVDLSKLKPGELLRVEWQGKPVWILSRTPEMLSLLEKVPATDLADPDSKMEQQPSYATNAWRSEKKEILVLVGICTHLGCSPTYRPNVIPAENWMGGFFCPCHGSKFDLAGRVYKNVPAPTNLIVPSYQFLEGNRLIIGQDKESA